MINRTVGTASLVRVIPGAMRRQAQVFGPLSTARRRVLVRLQTVQPFPMKKPTRYVIAVDFDGTCVSHDYPRIGHDIGAVPVLRRLVASGASLVLWTMRSGKELDDAVQWFLDNDIFLFGIQRNPEQDKWTTSPKAYASLYIDDAALGCPLVRPANGARPYVDWRAVEGLLFTPHDEERWLEAIPSRIQ